MEKETYRSAQKFCRMTDREIEMAKELKIAPKSLIRTEKSSESERWKTPAALWVRRLYEKSLDR